MPALSTLVDNFNDGVVGPDWGNSYGGVYESGGTAHVPCTTGYAGYQTAYSWTLADSGFFVAVAALPDPTGASSEAYASIFVNHPSIEDGDSPYYGVRVGFLINAVSGLMRLSSETGYWDDNAVTLTYSPTDHKFLRLREESGTLYWDTSPDGTTWTTRRSLTTPGWVATGTNLGLDMSAHRDSGTPDDVEYDYFNSLSDGDMVDGSADLTAQSSLTATGILVANAHADLTSDSDLTATAQLVVTASATLTGDGTLTATAESSEIPGVAEVAAGHWDLVIEQGATFVQHYTVTTPDFTWDGWTPRAQIRTTWADIGDLLLDLTPYLTVDGPTIRLAIPASVTQTLTRNGRWDLEMVHGGTVVRILEGKAVVSLEVTRT